jgi:hypothetical protein
VKHDVCPPVEFDTLKQVSWIYWWNCDTLTDFGFVLSRTRSETFIVDLNAMRIHLRYSAVL